MSYDLHIHRKDNWYDETPSKILSFEEWLGIAENDDELVVVGSYGSNRFSFEIPVFGWPKPSGDEVSFVWDGNEVEVIFSTERAIIKAYDIAQKLDAKLQGDDGKIFRSDGTYYHEAPLEDTQSVAKSKSNSFLSRLFKR